jgi:hypothetical protein
MSKRSDASQGMVAAPERPTSRPTAKPITAGAVRKQLQPALDARDAAQTIAKAHPREKNRQDYRRG